MIEAKAKINYILYNNITTKQADPSLNTPTLGAKLTHLVSLSLL